MLRQVEINLDVDYKVLKIILLNLKQLLSEDNTGVARAREAKLLGAFLVMSFVYILRGNEGFTFEAEGL